MRRRVSRLPDMSFRACGGEYFAWEAGLVWRVFRHARGHWLGEALDPETGMIGNVGAMYGGRACRTPEAAMQACAASAGRPGCRTTECAA